ncbi:hypothetical protein M378DRAFT_182735, partial [Amanita muscaria Koide BX008]
QRKKWVLVYFTPLIIRSTHSDFSNDSAAEPASEAAKTTREKHLRKPSQKALAAMVETSSDESLPENIGKIQFSLDQSVSQGLESEPENNQSPKSIPDSTSPIKKKASQTNKTAEDMTPRAKRSPVPKITEASDSKSDQDDHPMPTSTQHRYSPASTPTTPKLHHKSAPLSAKKPIFPSFPTLGTLYVLFKADL